MTQLQGLPVDVIKLDARITGAGVDAKRTEAMCQEVLEVLEVCQRIGLTVIAQGVETKEQAEGLRGMGCEFGQGEWCGAAVRVQRVEKGEEGARCGVEIQDR